MFTPVRVSDCFIAAPHLPFHLDTLYSYIPELLLIQCVYCTYTSVFISGTRILFTVTKIAETSPETEQVTAGADGKITSTETRKGGHQKR